MTSAQRFPEYVNAEEAAAVQRERRNNMRVADSTTQRNYLSYLDQAKTNYAETNLRVASGKRFTAISDDVSAGTRVLRVRDDLKKAEVYDSTVKSVNEQLSVTEDAITSINTALQNVHTKILKAQNSTTGTTGKDALANEISAIKGEVLQYLNTRYNNSFVLGGSGSTSAPFTVDSESGALKYNGIEVSKISYDSATGDYTYMDGATKKTVPMNSDVYADIGLGLKMTGSDVQSDTAFKISYSGLDVIGVSTVKTGAAANNFFDLLTKIEKTMRSDDAGSSDTLGSLDEELVADTDTFAKFLTDVGTKTSYLDTIQTSIETKIDSYETQIKDLMGINDAKEATNQTLNDYVLKAVLSMGSKILPLSLMDYVK